MVQLSVLIMGAAGRSGQALMKHFLLENKKREEEEDENDEGNKEEKEQSANKKSNAAESTKDSTNTNEKCVEEMRIHAFCRSRQQLSKEILSEVDAVIEGDALNKEDVQRALIDSNADYVVVAIGQGKFLGKGTVRTDTAYTIASTIRDGSRFDKVKVIVLSAVGAGGSKISLGWGRGAAISYLMKNVFEDHSGQEREFLLMDTKESTSLAAQAGTNATAEDDNASTDNGVELDDSIYNAGSMDDMSSDEEDDGTEKNKPKEGSGSNSKDIEVQETTPHMEPISEDAKAEIQDANTTEANEHSRVLIVRLTGLTDRDPTGNIITFEEHERCPSAFVSRSDVAQYVYKRILNNSTRHEKMNGIVSITGGT